MFWMNVRIVLVVLGTLGTFTLVANSIPQVQSEVPEELSFSADVSAEELVAAGEALYNGAGACTSCHGLGTRAPNLLTDDGSGGTIGARCGERVPGQSCKEYLHESLVDPPAFVVGEFPPIMPDQSRTMSPAQIWSLVAYLESVGGEVTVTGADIAGDAGEDASGQVAAGGTLEPLQLLQQSTCLACHALEGPGPVGPSFAGIGARMSEDEIRTAILDPNASVAAGYENMAGSMPPNFGDILSEEQLDAIVEYLASLR
jgi:mono/diheme cytochrome c family protein